MAVCFADLTHLRNLLSVHHRRDIPGLARTLFPKHTTRADMDSPGLTYSPLLTAGNSIIANLILTTLTLAAQGKLPVLR